MNQNPDMTITKGQKRVQKQQETMKLRGKQTQKDGENYDMQLKPLKSMGVVENDLKISEYKRRS